MRILSLQAAREALRTQFGDEVRICLQPDIEPDKLEDDGDAVPEGKRKTADEKRAALWVCDPFANPPKMATRGDGNFFEVVMDDSMGYWQPLVVDEPKRAPGQIVGVVRASIAFCDGNPYVRVVRAQRPASGGKASPALLECDRASLSKNPNLGAGGIEVGAPVYPNSARIGRGPVLVVFEKAPVDTDVLDSNWMLLRDYLMQGTDPMGITAVVRAALYLRLMS